MRGLQGRVGRPVTWVIDLVGRPTLAVSVALALVLWWTHGVRLTLVGLLHALWFVVFIDCLLEMRRETQRIRGRMRRSLPGGSFRERLASVWPLLLRLAAVALVAAAVRLLPRPA